MVAGKRSPVLPQESWGAASTDPGYSSMTVPEVGSHAGSLLLRGHAVINACGVIWYSAGDTPSLALDPWTSYLPGL